MALNQHCRNGLSSTIKRLLPIYIALHMPTAQGHFYLDHPLQTNKEGCMGTNYQAEVAYKDLDPAFSDFQHKSPPENAKYFNGHFNKTKWKTLAEMIDSVVPDCVCTDTEAKPVDVSSLNYCSVRNDEYKVGFIQSHTGGCMATLDGKTLFQNDNCVEAYPGYPAIIKVSYESCVTDTCLFIFYAVALHGEKVQIYKKCVTVTNGEKGKPKSDPGKAPGAGTPPQGTPPQGTPPKETPPSNPPAQVQPQPKVEVPEPNPKHKDEPSGDNKPHPTIKHDVVSPTSSNPPAPAPHGETSDKRKKCREVE